MRSFGNYFFSLVAITVVNSSSRSNGTCIVVVFVVKIFVLHFRDEGRT